MQRHLGMQQRMHRRADRLHLGKALGLDHGQRPGTGIVDQVEIVLPQIGQEGGARQRAVPQPLDKGVTGIGGPGGGAGGAPQREGATVIGVGCGEGHCGAPGSSASCDTGSTLSISPASFRKASKPA
ncbi:hypothetical protein SDC9_60655 [bioreactor metagenome]|uniref:Uncharacterized protein n=1 Tax=bioreactor metagenome TaxID=1076179 RepID=A0A644XJ96_9ZZZZ